MTQLSFNTIKISDSFSSAEENMKFDEKILEEIKENERVERFYIWKRPGITLQFKQQCPNNLHIDHSVRLTGGGIVFFYLVILFFQLHQEVMILSIQKNRQKSSLYCHKELLKQWNHQAFSWIKPCHQQKKT